MCSYLTWLIKYTHLCFPYPIINVQSWDRKVHCPPSIKLCLLENVPGCQNDNKWKSNPNIYRNNMNTIISGANWGATHLHLFGLGLRTIITILNIVLLKSIVLGWKQGVALTHGTVTLYSWAMLGFGTGHCSGTAVLYRVSECNTMVPGSDLCSDEWNIYVVYYGDTVCIVLVFKLFILLCVFRKQRFAT
jgi:hypothetical protein